MVRDLYAGHRAAQMMSTLMTVVMAIAPLLGPSAGGLILQVASWRAIFWTRSRASDRRPWPPSERRRRHCRRRAATTRRSGARSPRTRNCSGIAGCWATRVREDSSMAACMRISRARRSRTSAYHHVSPQLYGVLRGIVGIMLTNQINARLVRKWAATG